MDEQCDNPYHISLNLPNQVRLFIGERMDLYIYPNIISIISYYVET